MTGVTELLSELSAESTLLALESQAERWGSAWYYFAGRDDDQLDVQHSHNEFQYVFYAPNTAGDPVRRSTAVRLLALAKKGLVDS